MRSCDYNSSIGDGRQVTKDSGVNNKQNAEEQRTHVEMDKCSSVVPGGQSTISTSTSCKPIQQVDLIYLKKANKTPEEANMKMRYRVYEPTVFSSIISSEIEVLWSDYKLSFV